MTEEKCVKLYGLTRTRKRSVVILLVFLLVSILFFVVVRKYEYDYYKMSSYDYLVNTNVDISVEYKGEK